MLSTTLILLAITGFSMLFLTSCGVPDKPADAKPETPADDAQDNGTQTWKPEEVTETLDNEQDQGEPVVRGAEVLCSNGEDDKDILSLLGNEDNSADMVGLTEMTKTDISLSNENKFKYCKFFAMECPGAVAEGNSWQLYDPKNDIGEDKNELDYKLSFMFCTKGWGIIHFKNSGQEMAQFIEEKDTCQFAGYLAYGAGGIVDDSSAGFFRLYSAPTLGSEQEQIYFKDLYEKYGMKPNGALQSFGGIAKVNKSGDIKYGGQECDPINGTLEYKGIERYAIALAPKLQNPKCDLTKKLEADEMAYGTCVDVAIDLGGETYYIPAIIADVKAHSAPDGIFQTGKEVGTGKFTPTGSPGNIVEWYFKQTEGDKNKSDGLKQFNSTGSIVIFRDEVLK